MTLVNLLLQTSDIELAMTRRMLERVPEDRPDWTPHPKSMPLGRLAMHVATLPGLAMLCLTTESFDFAAHPAPHLVLRSGEHLLQTFDENAAAARNALADSSGEHLEAPWQLYFGERLIVSNPRALVLNHMFLGHLIHHRAQLGTYLRLLDLPVPAVYGPSADERP